MMGAATGGPRLQPRARAGAAAARLLGAADGADDDLLAFLELAAEDLGRVAVADAEREVHGLELLAVHHVHAAGRADVAALAAAAALARAHLVVLRALLGREHLADTRARGFTDARALGLPILLGEAHHLLARVGEGPIHLCPLLLVGVE